jgi:hypothetical protein
MSTAIIILVAFFAWLGAVANAFLQWASQSPRPPLSGVSVLTALIVSAGTAAGIAEGFNYSGITNNALSCIGAFLSGMGLTAAISGVAGAFIKSIAPHAPAKISPPSGLTTKASSRYIFMAFYRRY